MLTQQKINKILRRQTLISIYIYLDLSFFAKRTQSVHGISHWYHLLLIFYIFITDLSTASVLCLRWSSILLQN